jgi:hypothetical protein
METVFIHSKTHLGYPQTQVYLYHLMLSPKFSKFKNKIIIINIWYFTFVSK